MLKILAVFEKGPNNPNHATPMVFDTIMQAWDWADDNAPGHTVTYWKLRDGRTLELIAPLSDEKEPGCIECLAPLSLCCCEDE